MSEFYYSRELGHLRELAAEFARAHPALAPMLSEQSADPDVERLLEGTAFLSGLLSEKLENDLPEIVHGLMRLVLPHYLRPIPSMSIIQFSPKPSLRETVTVPRGTRIDSVPVNSVSCGFSTCYDVPLHPLQLTHAAYQHVSGQSARVILGLQLKGVTLNSWSPGPLRFYLTGPFPQAATRFHLLANNIRSIRVQSASADSDLNLPGAKLRAVGFAPEESLLPYPGNAFPGYRIIQEYFIFPEKFLFFELTGLEQWTDRDNSTSFVLTLELIEPPQAEPEMKSSHFALFAAPIINLFPSSAEPILLDHRKSEYLIRPSGGSVDQFQVYAVDKVTGVEQGTVATREYMPFEMFNPQAQAAPVYTVHTRPSALGQRAEMLLSVAYTGQEKNPRRETLSLDIQCTNADLPESLEPGDISKPTETSPELASFENIRNPTSPAQPPLGKNMLWRFLSHLYLNYLSIADAASLREILKLYIFSQTREQNQVLANTRRIEALTDLQTRPAHRIFRGQVLRGRDIVLTLDPNGFTGPGDIRLFCSVLDSFLAGYGAINNYTRLIVRDTLGKELFQCPARLGERHLL